MQSVTSYVSDLVDDIKMTIRCEIEGEYPLFSSAVQVNRVVSLFFRVIGGAAAVSATYTALKIITGVPFGPTTILVGIVWQAVIAHDCIQVGYNVRKIFSGLETAQDSNRGIFVRIFGLYENTKQLGGAVLYEASTGCSYIVQKTIILEPVYKLFFA